MELEVYRPRKRCKRTSAELPEEIVGEILLHLPARSVLRFRAVCRAWSALLRSPSFADAYAARAASYRSTKFVFFAAPSAAYRCAQDATVAEPLLTVDRLSADFLCLSSKPCRGLLLFSDTRSATHWVCNPSTGECERLPKQRHRRPSLSSAGLVLDDRTNKCKVIHLFLAGGEIGPLCEVYTLSAQDRRWRPVAGTITLPLQSAAIQAMQFQSAVTKIPPVYANRYLYWLVYPNLVPGLSPAVLFCFSVAEEKFSIVNAPAGEELTQYRQLEEDSVPIHLAELGGSLCMVHDLRHSEHGGSYLEIWMLRDHSASQWSLDHRIAIAPLLARGVHSPRFITVLAYCGGLGKKKIMLTTSQHNVYSYDLQTGAVQILLSVSATNIGPQKEAPASLQLALYEDSLVRIGGDESHQEKEMLSALTKILVRLPLISVIKSKLVCRQWCTLIESESFVRSHMSMNRLKGIFMVTNGAARQSFFSFTPLESWLQPNAALADTLTDDKIICSKPCNGLNLISTNSDDYLCNPCTGSIRCLGSRGKLRQGRNNNSRGKHHAFSVGRNIGLGFDQSTGEHVVVEIGHFRGSLACMVKTSNRDVWSYVGKPPMPVIDMPPAHIGGTLYWLSEKVEPCETQAPQERVVVSFGISARTFSCLPCHSCQSSEHNAFLVELNGILSLVVANTETEELDIWMMHKRGAWANAFKICLRKQPEYSPRTCVVVPLEIDGKRSKILLNTGRTLGYYDTETKAIHTLYSADQLQLPHRSLVFPMSYEESLVRIPDDELLDCTAVISNANEGVMSERSEHNKSPRSIFQKCENSRCQRIVIIYRTCCRRMLCRKCAAQCRKHSQEKNVLLSTGRLDSLQNLYNLAVPLVHPFVPGPDYCYYYSTRQEDAVRHIFISLKDYVRNKLPCHLTECGYGIEGQVIRETWVRRYRVHLM